ncbi:hypothetical protein CR513_59022, partial [Mucuna pruriens]
NCFPSIQEDKLREIDKPLSNLEIKEALFNIGNFKSLGEDGLQIKSLSKTLICLIPKIENVTYLKHFCLISLCNEW